MGCYLLLSVKWEHCSMCCLSHGFLKRPNAVMCVKVLYRQQRPFCFPGWLILLSADVTPCLRLETPKRRQVHLAQSSICNRVAIPSWLRASVHGGEVGNTSSACKRSDYAEEMGGCNHLTLGPRELTATPSPSKSNPLERANLVST